MQMEEFLKQCNVDVAPPTHEHSREGWLQVDCPYCSKDWKHFRLGYNVKGNYFNCWGCGSHPLVATLLLLCDTPYAQIKRALDELSVRFHDKKVERTDTKLVLPQPMHELKPAHIDYLRRRGFNPKKLIEQWHLRATSIHPTLRWRIVAPITLRRKIVSWTTRSLVNTGIRWLSAKPTEELISHKSILYGLDYVKHAAIVVEGPSDVWNVGSGAVGTMGMGYSQSQVNLISKIPRRIICFDSSPDAQQRANELCDTLQVLPGETWNVVLDAEDPGSASKKEIKRLRRTLTV